MAKLRLIMAFLALFGTLYAVTAPSFSQQLAMEFYSFDVPLSPSDADRDAGSTTTDFSTGNEEETPSHGYGKAKGIFEKNVPFNRQLTGLLGVEECTHREGRAIEPGLEPPCRG